MKLLFSALHGENALKPGRALDLGTRRIEAILPCTCAISANTHLIGVKCCNISRQKHVDCGRTFWMGQFASERLVLRIIVKGHSTSDIMNPNWAPSPWDPEGAAGNTPPVTVLAPT